MRRATAARTARSASQVPHQTRETQYRGGRRRRARRRQESGVAGDRVDRCWDSSLLQRLPNSNLGQESTGKVCTFTPFTRNQTVNAPSPRIAIGIMKGAKRPPMAGARKFAKELIM